MVRSGTNGSRGSGAIFFTPRGSVVRRKRKKGGRGKWTRWRKGRFFDKGKQSGVPEGKAVREKRLAGRHGGSSSKGFFGEEKGKEPAGIAGGGG